MRTKGESAAPARGRGFPVQLFERLALADSPDRVFDMLCAAVVEATRWRRAVFFASLPSGLALGSAGLDDEERLRLRKRLARFAPLGDASNRGRLLADHRLVDGVDAVWVTGEAREGLPDEILAGDGCWRPGDELLVLPHAENGESLGTLAVADPEDGRRPDASDREALVELERVARVAGALVAGRERARQQGQDETRQVLRYVESLAGIHETDELLDRIAELCARIAGYRVGVLTVHMDDGPRLGAWNLRPGERRLFEESMQRSTLSGTAAKRRRIRELCFPGTGIAYVPRDADLSRSRAFRQSDTSPEPGSWHAEDRLFIVVRAQHGADIGVLSLDEPLDGEAPTWSSLGALRTAERFLQLGGALLESRILDAHLVRAQRLEALGTLAAGVAHDFNNLMGVVVGYASLLRTQAAETADVKQMARAVERAAQRAAALTERLRALSRVEADTRQPLDMRRILDDCLRIARETFDRRIEIEAEVADDLPALEGDPAQIYRCVMNLCINARDALPEGGRIRLHAAGDIGAGLFSDAPSARRVVVTVEDDGPGIEESLRDRVFEPFFTTKARDRNLGLGLYTSYGVARAHGGTIEIREGSGGEGTAVRLILPASERPGRAPTPAPPVETPDEPAADVPVAPARVLVVEDERLIRELLVRGIEMMGHRVEVAGDGEVAIRMLDEDARRADLVVLDLVLPKRSGLDVFRHLRRIAPDVPVLVSSGNVDEGLRDPALAEAAAGTLRKPWRLQDLQAAVRRVLAATAAR